MNAAEHAYGAAYRADGQHAGNKRETALRAARKAEASARNARAMAEEEKKAGRSASWLEEAAEAAKSAARYARSVARGEAIRKHRVARRTPATEHGARNTTDTQRKVGLEHPLRRTQTFALYPAA